MKDRKRILLFGIGAGLTAGLLDVGLIAAFDKTASQWVLLESFLFWLTAGWIIVAADTGLGSFSHAALASVLLCTPWYVAEAFASGHPEHLPPLVIQSIVFGLGFGWAKRKTIRVALH